MKRLGIHGKSFHCLRHTFATRRAQLGDTIDEIRLKMGHVSTATTEGYVQKRRDCSDRVIRVNFNADQTARTFTRVSRVACAAGR